MRVLASVDISCLNEQMNAYHAISTHYTSTNQHPLHMLMLGTAGTEKSFLIQAIAQLLQDKCMLTATTGIAAFHIGGITLISALHLPIQKHNCTDLRGQTLAKLQHKISNIKYLIVNEVSMLGQNMMAWIDKRLRQATTHLDMPCGGISVILIGILHNCRQLVIVHCLHQINQAHMATMYNLFTKIVILDQVIRQSGANREIQQFRQILLRLRNGQSTEDDWTTLLQHTLSTASNANEFNYAMRLFYTKEQYNHEAITKLTSSIARINAINSSAKAASATSDDAGGLQPVVFMAKGAKVMLTSNLRQQAGLYNGTRGTVDNILYAEGQKPPSVPIAITVDFPDYNGPSFFPNKPKCIPIPPIVHEWHDSSNTLSTQQLPLRLNYAMTIHTSLKGKQ